MNIVETDQDLTILFDKISRDTFYFDVVTLDDQKHYTNNDISLMFFKFMADEESWCLPINHNEATPLSDVISKFKECLNKSKAKVFVKNKKNIVQLLKKDYAFIDLGIIEYLESGKMEEDEHLLTNAHIFIKSNFRGASNLNRAIPLFKHASVFENTCKSIRFELKLVKEDGFKFVNDVMSNCFAELERIGMKVNTDKFLEVFGETQKKHIRDGYVHSQYNLFTSTGRPSNRFGGVNYAALNKTDGSRDAFVSRYGDDGMLVMMDYNAFHPRLMAHLMNYPMPANVNPYEYLAKYYFNKNEVDEEDVAVSKGLTFHQMYGGIDEKWMYIPYFKKAQEYIDHRWKFFKENGYIETPMFSRKIKKCHIDDPSPNKLFNYILQAYETEMAVNTLQSLLEYSKNKKTKPVLYTYDSILFDAHKEDKITALQDIKKIMEGDKFPVKVYVGKTYGDMKQIGL